MQVKPVALSDNCKHFLVVDDPPLLDVWPLLSFDNWLQLSERMLGMMILWENAQAGERR